MARGNNAEHPSPASANVRTPSAALLFGTQAVAVKAAVTTNGRARQTNRWGNPLFEGGEEHTSGRNHAPEVRERERREGRARSKMLRSGKA